MLKGFKMNRNAEAGHYVLSQIFSGSMVADILKRIFPHEADEQMLMQHVKVEISVNSPRYMRVAEDDGRVMVGKKYLQTADEKSLYLDLTHELIHVRQFHEGHNLYDPRYSYVDRATEIEAYRFTVEEARKLGMKDDEISKYLYVEWLSQKDHLKLTRKLGLNVTNP